MTKRALQSIIAIVSFHAISAAQSAPIEKFADSLRKKYEVPELAFAVLSQGKISEKHVIGTQLINSSRQAGPNDRFRIGSNTKTITALIAAMLVEKNKIEWSTRFFDLFPDLKASSNSAYYDLTLIDLLSFREKMIRWTYTDPKPAPGEFTGSESSQRLQFIKWVLAQPPVTNSAEINFSNPAYVAAGMMLEKCSGADYKKLVAELGDKLKVSFGFGAPNMIDSLRQPWGHNAALEPEAPGENVRLSWLLPAGNINITLPDYCRLLQAHLDGLAGKSTLLTQKNFEFLFSGLPGFSVGWFSQQDEVFGKYHFHLGNPGTYLSKVFIFRDFNTAFILLSNCQSEGSEEALNLLEAELEKRFLVK